MSYCQSRFSSRRWVRLLLVVLLVGFVLAASAQEEDESHEDEQPHRLENTVLCVDPNSVLIMFDEVRPGRAKAARAKVLPAVQGILKSTLAKSKVAVEFPKSCAGRDGFVLALAQVTFLDPNLYTRNGYGRQTFGLTLSVQVGAYAHEAYFADHYVLSGTRFTAFDEIAYSELEHNVGFEQHLISQTRQMVGELVQAWQEDNP